MTSLNDGMPTVTRRSGALSCIQGRSGAHFQLGSYVIQTSQLYIVHNIVYCRHIKIYLFIVGLHALFSTAFFSTVYFQTSCDICFIVRADGEISDLTGFTVARIACFLKTTMTFL